MRAGFIEAPLKAYFTDDMPEPMIGSADQVKIRVRKCGICGSEVHAYHGKHHFRIPPVVSGHEFSGDVVETECVLQKARPPFYFAKGSGTVAGQLSVKAEFSFALMEEPECSPKS